MLRSILFCTLFIVANLVYSQDLTGIWRGTFYNEYEYMFTGAKYRYEVQLKNTGQAIKGVTYSYQTTRFYGKANMIGRWAPATGDLTLKEDKMLDLKITGGGDGCLMTCYLSYRKEGDREYLEGNYTSVNMRNDTIPCGGGIVRLEKVPDSDFELEDFLKEPQSASKTPGGTKPGQNEFLIKKPSTTTTPPAQSKTSPNNSTAKSNPKQTTPTTQAKPKPATPVPGNSSAQKSTPNKAPSTSSAKKTESEVVGSEPAKKEPNTAKTVEATKETKPIAKPAPPAVLKTRQNEVFETISTSSKELEISFYDNGEIDGDTISVYDNNRMVVSKRGLSAEPITIKVKFDDNDLDHEIVMVAENLGSIPPNTALMIVQAGSQRYTVRLASTEQKNAVVRFRYKADSLN